MSEHTTIPNLSRLDLETAEAYYARVRAAADSEGRLPTLSEDAVSEWDIFPYETENLRVRPLAPLQDVEPDRRGEDPATCWCARKDDAPGEHVKWRNDRWQLSCYPGCLPFMGSLSPLTHHDLTDLPLGLAAEMGQLVTVIGQGIEALPSVGRVHVNKWGDGGAHLHLQLFGRPARMGQLRGSCLPDWTEHLPEIPSDVAQANVRAVVGHLVSVLGGEDRTTS